MPKDKRKRFKVRTTIDGVPGVSGNSYDTLKDARGDATKCEGQADMPEIVIIDTKTNTVEQVKGNSLDRFREILDKLHAGWKVGTISE